MMKIGIQLAEVLRETYRDVRRQYTFTVELPLSVSQFTTLRRSAKNQLRNLS